MGQSFTGTNHSSDDIMSVPAQLDFVGVVYGSKTRTFRLRSCFAGSHIILLGLFSDLLRSFVISMGKILTSCFINSYLALHDIPPSVGYSPFLLSRANQKSSQLFTEVCF